MRRRTNALPASSLARWYSATAVAGGVLFLAWGYFHRGAGPVFLAKAEVPLHLRLVAFMVPLLFSVTLFGIYARLAGRAGMLGGAGFVLAFFGSGLATVQGAANVGFLLGPLNAYLLEIGLPHQLLGWLPPLLTGLVLIGIATARTGALERWSLLPLAAGLFGWAYQLTDFSDAVGLRLVHVAFGVLFSMCWIVLGCALGAGQSRPERRRQ